MNMEDKSIIIEDWAGNLLYIGEYDNPEVDKVLDANRCDCEDGCDKCDNTGYIGDFTVQWIDGDNDHNGLNVYEYINY